MGCPNTIVPPSRAQIVRFRPSTLTFLVRFQPGWTELFDGPLFSIYTRIRNSEGLVIITDNRFTRVSYCIKLNKMPCTKGRGMRWLANLNDLKKVPGLYEVLSSTGLFLSIGPNTKTVLLSRLVCAMAGKYVEWGSEDMPPDDWFTVHHLNGDPSDDRIENLEVLRHEEHERTHHLHGVRSRVLLVMV